MLRNFLNDYDDTISVGGIFQIKVNQHTKVIDFLIIIVQCCNLHRAVMLHDDNVKSFVKCRGCEVGVLQRLKFLHSYFGTLALSNAIEQ